MSITSSLVPPFMDTYYIDWSQRRGVTVIRNESDTADVHPTLDKFLDTLTRPSRIILEATFESFNLKRRKNFIERCQREEHILLTVPTRETTKARYRAGFGEKKDGYPGDAEDAKAIRYEAQHGMHLKVPQISSPKNNEVSDLIAHDLMIMRSTGEYTSRPRSIGYSFRSSKDMFAEKLVPHLPSYGSLTDTQKIALGNGEDYSLSTIADVGIISMYVTTTRQFDREAGLFVHAHPSQARADLMFWNWAGGQKRPKLNEFRKRDDITLSEWRREMRWLYHHLKKIPVRQIREEFPS